MTFPCLGERFQCGQSLGPRPVVPLLRGQSLSCVASRRVRLSGERILQQERETAHRPGVQTGEGGRNRKQPGHRSPPAGQPRKCGAINWSTQCNRPLTQVPDNGARQSRRGRCRALWHTSDVGNYAHEFPAREIQDRRADGVPRRGLAPMYERLFSPGQVPDDVFLRADASGIKPRSARTGTPQRTIPDAVAADASHGQGWRPKRRRPLTCARNSVAPTCCPGK